jgi:hypothetical protein
MQLLALKCETWGKDVFYIGTFLNDVYLVIFILEVNAVKDG